MRAKQFVNEKFIQVGWVRERWDDCRFAAVEMYETSSIECEYVDCKFASVNWRNSKFQRVVFRNCIFDKVDLSGGTFMSCSFIKCDFQNVTFDKCQVGQKKIDFRGTKFGDVAGLEALAGSTLSYEQAVSLLPLFMHEKGIKIAEDE